MNEDKRDSDAAASEDCGCAPSETERRTLWPAGRLTRRSALAVGALGVVSLGAFGISSATSAAYAASYPNWDDVQRAKQSQSAKAAEITRIQNLIASLTQKAADAQAAAEQASNAFYEAQQAFFESAQEAEDLQTQADEQSKKADEAAQKAGQVATNLYRNGGDEASLELFFSGSAASADGLLSRLGSMDKLLQYNRSVYDSAVSARNSAQSLSDQAEVKRKERDRLQQVAEQKMQAAQAAADAAQAALAEKEANLSTLQAQLAALQDTTAKTVAAYEEGERVRKAAEEAQRKADEERRRREQENNNNNGGGGGGGNSGGGGGGGGTSSSGWAKPHGGYISSGYGYRPPRCVDGVCRSTLHAGTDLANGCGARIYAAHSGTVLYAGPNGGYGNYIKLDHGGGIGTGYAHIRPGGILVGRGQRVSAGQLIAYAGNTGASQGCHLHFEVYVNGGTTNAVPFMAARGVYLG